MLVQYVRNNGDKIGVVVALSKDMIGWSQCNKKDKFDKTKGIKIAVGRAEKGTNKKPVKVKIECYDRLGLNSVELDLINTEVLLMKERAQRYFK